MRRLRQYWPVILAVTFIVGTVTAAVLLVVSVTAAPGLFVGTWEQDGGHGNTVKVVHHGDSYWLDVRTASGAQQRVPATESYRRLEAVIPGTLAGQLSAGLTGADQYQLSLSAAPDGKALVATMSAEQTPSVVVESTFHARSFALSWIVEVVTVCAFMAFVVLLSASRSSVLTRRDKVTRILAVVVGALLAVGIFTGNPTLMFPAWPFLGACWVMFLMRFVSRQVPVLGEGIAAIFSGGARERFRERLDAQDEQTERTAALDALLDRVVAERGDRTSIDEAARGED